VEISQETSFGCFKVYELIYVSFLLSVTYYVSNTFLMHGFDQIIRSLALVHLYLFMPFFMTGLGTPMES